MGFITNTGGSIRPFLYGANVEQRFEQKQKLINATDSARNDELRNVLRSCRLLIEISKHGKKFYNRIFAKMDEFIFTSVSAVE